MKIIRADLQRWPMTAMLASLLFASIPVAAENLANREPPFWERLAGNIGKPLDSLPGLKGSGRTGWVFHAKGGKPRAVLVCLHGIQTHSAWFAPLAKELTPAGITLVCPDRRGSGADAGNSDRTARPPAGGWTVWVSDVQKVIDSAARLGAPVYLLGTSWGAKTALACQTQAGAKLDGTVLLVPALKTKKETFPVKLSTVLSCLIHWRTGAALPLHDADYLPGRLYPKSSANAVRFLDEMGKDAKLKRRSTLGFQKQARRMQSAALEKPDKAPATGRGPQVVAIFNEQTDDQIVDAQACRQALSKLGAVNEPAIPAPAGHGVQILNPTATAKAVLAAMHLLHQH